MQILRPPNPYPPVPYTTQRQNLESVKDRKRRKLEKLLNSARKEGQIRALERISYLLDQEIKKEIKELEMIDSELMEIEREPRN